MNHITGEMSPPGALMTEIDQPDFKVNKAVISAALALGSLILHPEIHFEGDAEQQIPEHLANGGSYFMLMTHFKKIEPGLVLPIFKKQEAFRDFRFNTTLVAREEMWKIPGIGQTLRGVKAVPLERSTEHPNETLIQKKAREARNVLKMHIVGRHLAASRNVLIMAEGASKETIIEDGQKKRIKRDSTTVLPIQKGFTDSMDAMTEEERKKVNLLIVVTHFGQRFLSTLRPTVYICEPAIPVRDRIELRQQAEDLMRGAKSKAIILDAHRR